MKKLIGRRAIIISDNENYSDFKDEILLITYASNQGTGYDSTMYPEMLCDFKTIKGEEIPFALYEYEFQLI